MDRPSQSLEYVLSEAVPIPCHRVWVPGGPPEPDTSAASTLPPSACLHRDTTRAGALGFRQVWRVHAAPDMGFDALAVDRFAVREASPGAAHAVPHVERFQPL